MSNHSPLDTDDPKLLQNFAGIWKLENKVILQFMLVKPKENSTVFIRFSAGFQFPFVFQNTTYFLLINYLKDIGNFAVCCGVYMVGNADR